MNMRKIVALCGIAFCSVCAEAQEPDGRSAEIVRAIEVATGWSAEELANGLEMLDRMYSLDMSNETGRVRWHGKVARTHFDTNALVKVTWYEDGWEFRENFERKSPPSVRSQLSAAEKKAIADKRKADEAARKEKIRQDRIALLTTNLTEETSALMARKKWPEELARLYLLQELNELRGTVEVAPTITPQN